MGNQPSSILKKPPSTSNTELKVCNRDDCNTQTSLINQLLYTNQGLLNFRQAPAPFVTCPTTFRISDDGNYLIPLKDGNLFLDVSVQIYASTGTVILSWWAGINGQALPGFDSSSLYWPAFLTGYSQVQSFSFSLSVKANDQIALGAILTQTDQNHLGQVVLGGPASYLTASLQ